MLIPLIVCAVFGIIGLWKIFQKAGKPGWASLVPVYNTYVLGTIVWTNRTKTIAWTIIVAVYAALSLISGITSATHSYSYSMGYSMSISSSDPVGSIASLVGVADFVFSILAMIALGKSFGKSGGYIVGLVLLSPFFMFALGISKIDRYLGPERSWIPMIYGQLPYGQMPGQYPYQQQPGMQVQQTPYQQAPYVQQQPVQPVQPQMQPQMNPNSQPYAQPTPQQPYGNTAQGYPGQYGAAQQQQLGVQQLPQQPGQYPQQRF